MERYYFQESRTNVTLFSGFKNTLIERWFTAVEKIVVGNIRVAMANAVPILGKDCATTPTFPMKALIYLCYNLLFY